MYIFYWPTFVFSSLIGWPWPLTFDNLKTATQNLWDFFGGGGDHTVHETKEIKTVAICLGLGPFLPQVPWTIGYLWCVAIRSSVSCVAVTNTDNVTTRLQKTGKQQNGQMQNAKIKGKSKSKILWTSNANKLWASAGFCLRISCSWTSLQGLLLSPLVMSPQCSSPLIIWTLLGCCAIWTRYECASCAQPIPVAAAVRLMSGEPCHFHNKW